MFALYVIDYCYKPVKQIWGERLCDRIPVLNKKWNCSNQCIPGVVEVLGVLGFPVPSNSFSSFHDASFLSAGGFVFFSRLVTSAPLPLETVVVIVNVFGWSVARGCLCAAVATDGRKKNKELGHGRGNREEM